MSAEPLRITELDRQLDGDVDGRVVKRFVEQLSEGKRRLQREMDRGVGSKEHARLTTLLSAYDAGIDALPKLWAALNQR